MPARYPVADKLIVAMMVEASPFLKALRDGPDEAPAGVGEQPSITDRDPGDESRVIVVDGRMPWQKQIDAQSADIAILESALREKDDMLAATYAELHEARRQIEMYRAALKEFQAKAAMTVPEGSFY